MWRDSEQSRCDRITGSDNQNLPFSKGGHTDVYLGSLGLFNCPQIHGSMSTALGVYMRLFACPRGRAADTE